MLPNFVDNARVAFRVLIFFTLLTGVVYPAVVTLIGKVVFPFKANGSLIKIDDKVIGSVLIGQQFSGVEYFWGRPSATTPMPYNALNSAGSNLGPLNPKLLAAVNDRVSILQKAHPENKSKITDDMITASASGLDPHISMRSAYMQVTRIARARNLNSNKIMDLISQQPNNSILNIYSIKPVNVLQLNLALDELQLFKRTP